MAPCGAIAWETTMRAVGMMQILGSKAENAVGRDVSRHVSTKDVTDGDNAADDEDAHSGCAIRAYPHRRYGLAIRADYPSTGTDVRPARLLNIIHPIFKNRPRHLSIQHCALQIAH